MTDKQLREFLNSSATKKQKLEALKKSRPDLCRQIKEEIKSELRPKLEAKLKMEAKKNKKKYSRWQRIAKLGC